MLLVTAALTDAFGAFAYAVSGPRGRRRTEKTCGSGGAYVALIFASCGLSSSRWLSADERACLLWCETFRIGFSGTSRVGTVTVPSHQQTLSISVSTQCTRLSNFHCAVVQYLVILWPCTELSNITSSEPSDGVAVFCIAVPLVINRLFAC